MENDYRQLIRQRAAELAEMLSQSPEYGQFVAARRKLEADGENSSILNDLRQQQMSLRMAAMLGEDVDEDNHDFENMYRLITQEPSINDYLFAEGRFLRLVADVEEVFSQQLGLWNGDEDTPRSPYAPDLN